MNLESLEQRAQIVAARARSSTKLEISLKVKYVLCALDHVTANSKPRAVFQVTAWQLSVTKLLLPVKHS